MDHIRQFPSAILLRPWNAPQLLLNEAPDGNGLVAEIHLQEIVILRRGSPMNQDVVLAAAFD